jgi:hypothetical protein
MNIVNGMAEEIGYRYTIRFEATSDVGVGLTQGTLLQNLKLQPRYGATYHAELGPGIVLPPPYLERGLSGIFSVRPCIQFFKTNELGQYEIAPGVYGADGFAQICGPPVSFKVTP